MSQPSYNVTELDGALGVLPPSSGALYALVGACSSGPIDTPATFARISDIRATFGDGPLVEAAAHAIEKYGRPVVIVRTAAATTVGDYGAIVDAVEGTAVITETASTFPLDDYEATVEIVDGGTTGVAGITYRTSLDGGRTWSPTTALGTGLVFPITGSGVSFTADTAKTLLAGDSWSCRTSAPLATVSELQAAIDALRDSAVAWEVVHVVGALDGAAFDALDLKVSGMATVGKYRAWIGHWRMPTAGETEAAYLAAFDVVFASRSSVHGMVCAGACWLISSVSGRQYQRPISYVVAAREASVSQEVNTADVNLGGLKGVAIRDDNGNAVHHDESINPGLDDARACVLRTWDGIQGVYVNRPQLLSPAGSDFQLLAHRRVMNIAHAALRLYFIRRLNKPIRVSASTGFILEADALEIEKGAKARMRALLLAKPKASAVQFTLSRTDNVLSTKTLSGSARVVPLAYPETIEMEVGFLNPALQVQTV